MKCTCSGLCVCTGVAISAVTLTHLCLSSRTEIYRISRRDSPSRNTGLFQQNATLMGISLHRRNQNRAKVTLQWQSWDVKTAKQRKSSSEVRKKFWRCVPPPHFQMCFGYRKRWDSAWDSDTKNTLPQLKHTDNDEVCYITRNNYVLKSPSCPESVNRANSDAIRQRKCRLRRHSET